MKGKKLHKGKEGGHWSPKKLERLKDTDGNMPVVIHTEGNKIVFGMIDKNEIITSTEILEASYSAQTGYKPKKAQFSEFDYKSPQLINNYAVMSCISISNILSQFAIDKNIKNYTEVQTIFIGRHFISTTNTKSSAKNLYKALEIANQNLFELAKSYLNSNDDVVKMSAKIVLHSSFNTLEAAMDLDGNLDLLRYQQSSYVAMMSGAKQQWQRLDRSSAFKIIKDDAVKMCDVNRQMYILIPENDEHAETHLNGLMNINSAQVLQPYQASGTRLPCLVCRVKADENISMQQVRKVEQLQNTVNLLLPEQLKQIKNITIYQEVKNLFLASNVTHYCKFKNKSFYIGSRIPVDKMRRASVEENLENPDFSTRLDRSNTEEFLRNSKLQQIYKILKIDTDLDAELNEIMKHVQRKVVYETKELIIPIARIVEAKQKDEEENSGNGTSPTLITTPIASSLYTYWTEGIEKILSLRLKFAELEDDVVALRPILLEHSNAKSIKGLIIKLADIINNNTESKKILIPINTENKHWVGLVIEGGIAYYMDSENNAVPSVLVDALHSIGLQFKQIQVEQQKYNNCGPEVIENFIWWLTDGYRLSQEDAVAIHSAIVEEDLLQKYQAYQDAMKAERGAVLVKAFQNKNFIPDEKLSAQMSYYIQAGGVFGTLRQFLGFDDNGNEQPSFRQENEDSIFGTIFGSQYSYEI